MQFTHYMYMYVDSLFCLFEDLILNIRWTVLLSSCHEIPGVRWSAITTVHGISAEPFWGLKFVI